MVRGGGLIAPHLALVEATNILRRLEIEGRLGRMEAGAAARDLLLFDLDLVPFTPFAERVWELRANVTSARFSILAQVLYCDCRASAGWTAAARCAGIQLAMNATTRRAAGVALSVTRSVGLTP